MNSPSRKTIAVYRSHDFRVKEGVAVGEPLAFFDDLVFDDIYHLSDQAERQVLSYQRKSDRTLIIDQSSTTGQAGNTLYLDCTITLIAPDSTTIEALVLVEVENGEAAEVYLMPLAQLYPRRDYRLVHADRENATAKFGEVACVRFARGTHITIGTGEQVPIEDLKVGDYILTRDAGPQQIRWIGETTHRALGEYAPVVIKEGTLFNSRDLLLSPDHRLFIYQREDRVGAGRSEILVKVRHLINGDSVYRQDGGFIDYFQILFDEHHIIYAEGIAAETLLVDAHTRAALPSEATRELPSHNADIHLQYELPESLANRPDIVQLLKRSSSN